MDDDTTPLQPEELDELLSAELDDELEAAERDLGMSTGAAAARLRATPGTAERRAALSAARDLLSVAPEIEELLGARLRAKAVRAAEETNATRAGDLRDRRRRFLLAAGGIAAAIAAVIGVAAGVSGSGSGSSKASSAPASRASTPEKAATADGRAPGPAPALGSFSDAHALAVTAVSRAPSTVDDSTDRDVAQQAGGRATSTTTSAGTPSKSNQILGGSGYKSAANQPTTAPAASGATRSTDRAALAAAACAAPPQLLLSAPVLRATATLSGKPVVVLVFAGAREHTVVVEDTNCALLNVQMLS